MQFIEESAPGSLELDIDLESIDWNEISVSGIGAVGSGLHGTVHLDSLQDGELPWSVTATPAGLPITTTNSKRPDTLYVKTFLKAKAYRVRIPDSGGTTLALLGTVLWAWRS